jgi:2-C-methyl-D-erythritol 4-phosphate cytidylyltransferase
MTPPPRDPKSGSNSGDPTDPSERGQSSPAEICAAAVIVAAGNSTRMGLGDGVRKPFIDVCGRTVLEHTVAAFAACPEIVEVVIVAQAEDESRIQALAESNPIFDKLSAVVPGGRERTDSVRNGVAACRPGLDLVAIHDCARLMIKTGTIAAALTCAAERGAALVAVPVVDTLKRSPDGELAAETLDRSVLWAAQTPQVFRPTQILELLHKGVPAGTSPTDDAALYEAWVGPIPIVAGESTNLKLTTPTDLEVVRALMGARLEGRKKND